MTSQCQAVTDTNPTCSTRVTDANRCFKRFPLDIILIAFPSFHASRASHLIIPTTPTPASIGHSDAWARYLDARVAEWKVTFTLACVLVGLSLTMYQIPQAANDPFTYAFASLTQCRAFAGLIYGAVLHIYFEGEYTRTGRFAIMWWNSVMESKDNLWNVWVMFSLPAASTIWALVFYFLAIISFIFRPTALAPEGHPMPFALTITLQVIIMVSTLSDLVCFAYIWITLKGYRKKYHALHEEA